MLWSVSIWIILRLY